MKRNILIIMGRYLPGYKGGGPARSIANLVECLGDEYNFKVVALDRDYGDTKPYENIKINTWNKVGKANVYYVPPKGFTFKLLMQLCKTVDLVYICGCFNDYAIKSLIMKRLNIIKTPIVVAAMGLFSPMAFKIKYRKKKLFIDTFNMLGLFKKIHWSATSKMEIKEINELVRTCDNFFIAQDLPRKVEGQNILKNKQAGELKVVFLSRISRKKNLRYAIQILQHATNSIFFTIYGPKEDMAYWKECETELNKLPPNVRWEYKGNVESNQVVEVLKKEQVFLFPTLGENYGHVIQEALSAGCVCVLSDQTPWQDLSEHQVGWVLSLEEKERFAEVLQNYTDMETSQFQLLSKKAVRYAILNSNDDELATGYRMIFNSF